MPDDWQLTSRTWSHLTGAFVAIVEFAARLLRHRSVFLQSRMDIDPHSLWYNHNFVSKTGGLFPRDSKTSRKIVEFDALDSVRRDMLVLLMRSVIERNIPGEVVEAGVYKGASAKLMHNYLPERTLYLFDTFQGYSQVDIEDEKAITGLTVPQNEYADVTEEALRNCLGLNSNVRIYGGHFPESCDERVLSSQFCLVHLDLDLYGPTRSALEIFYPRVSVGGIIVVHDYNAWPGARMAVDEFFSGRKETIVPMPDKSGSCVVIKL